MATLYPLQFEPIFRRYLWGGRKLGQILEKPIGEQSCAESWELVDHGPDQSVITTGSLAGMTLSQLLSKYPKELLGKHAEQSISSFPLLFKFLDANKPLSVQVHPNDQQASKLEPPDLGKTEAWIILAAEADSKIYAGLKNGIDRETFEREVSQGTTDRWLHWFQPEVGDCVFIPAGTIHALGAGLLVAEIQQASDTTYRLFDWNRLDADGNSRELHVQQALEVIDFDSGPIAPQLPQKTTSEHIETLVTCEKFILDRWQFDSAQEIKMDDQFHIFVILEGEVRLEYNSNPQVLSKGQTILFPAEIDHIKLTPTKPTVALDMYLPF